MRELPGIDWWLAGMKYAALSPTVAPVEGFACTLLMGLLNLFVLCQQYFPHFGYRGGGGSLADTKLAGSGHMSGGFRNKSL